MKSKPLLVLTVIAAAAILVGTSCSRPESTQPVVGETVSNHGSVRVEWETDFPDAIKRAQSEGKPVLVNFYAEWCVWCKQLETVTFRDQKVAAMLAETVVPLNIDIDGDVAEIVRDHRIQAPPTIVVFSQGGEELGRIPGYLPPSSFLIVVEKILRGEPVRLG